MLLGGKLHLLGLWCCGAALAMRAGVASAPAGVSSAVPSSLAVGPLVGVSWRLEHAREPRFAPGGPRLSECWCCSESKLHSLASRTREREREEEEPKSSLKNRGAPSSRAVGSLSSSSSERTYAALDAVGAAAFELRRKKDRTRPPNVRGAAAAADSGGTGDRGD